VTIFTVKRADRVIFPLDERLGLPAGSLSPCLRRDVVWLSALLPYAQASAVLWRIGRHDLPTTTLWDHTQQVGAAWLEQEQHDHVSVERTRWEQRDYQPFLRKSIGIDGGMVNIRDEGWKELKVGAIGTLAPPWTLDEGQNARSHALHYTACLGGVDDFAPRLWQLAVQQRVPYAGHVAVTADGAGWIWRLSADLFPCSTQIVDWYHASQQAATLAQARFPDDPAAARRWHNTLKRYLWRGEGWKVIAEAQAADLAASYFLTHQHRMDYPSYRADGYPVGSGTTESGVKQYKQRLCGAGMRWSRPNVNRMIVLRSAAMTDAFDQRWAAA
jgi:hypothetical protein